MENSTNCLFLPGVVHMAGAAAAFTGPTAAGFAGFFLFYEASDDEGDDDDEDGDDDDCADILREPCEHSVDHSFQAAISHR